MSNVKDIAQSIYDIIGGSSNIVSFTHCMTRLRIVLKDQSDLYMKAIKKNWWSYGRSTATKSTSNNSWTR